MEVNRALLDKLRIAAERERELSTFFSQQIVEAEQRLRLAAIGEGLRRRDLENAGGRPPRQAYHDQRTQREAGEQRDPHAESRDRAAAEQTARRPSIMESARNLARQAVDAGRGADAVVSQFVNAFGRDVTGFVDAHESAVRAREAAEREVAELVRERGVHGRKAGLLSQTIAEGERFLAAQAGAWGRRAA